MIEGRLTLFTETDLDRLHGAVLRILDEPGVRVCHEAFLDALAAAGANVNKAAGVARFPARLVEDFLDERRKRARPCETPVRDHTSAYAPSVGCVIAPFLHDFEHRARRPGTREDLIEIVRWADVDTPETCRVSQAVTMSDVDPRIEPIEAYALLLEHSARPPEAAFVSEVDQIPFLLDISEVYYGRRVFPHGANFMTSPLTF
jgi:trimethylamine:corrinoid methyltransferase-like protein